jgi:putative transcriptional regulator
MSSKLSLPWLLVATPQLMDPNFKKSVVLIVEHTAAGSMGFIINRPIHASLADLVSNPKIPIPDNIPGWYGGPVETGTGIILHNGETVKAEGDTTPTIALSSSEETLVDLVDYSAKRSRELAQHRAGSGTPPIGPLYPYRFLVGYSGWGAGQLMEEIRSGAWLQLGATQEMLFDTNWQTLWETAMGKVGVNPKAIAIAEHQYLN